MPNPSQPLASVLDVIPINPVRTITPYINEGLPVRIDHNAIMCILTAPNAGIIPSRSAYRDDADVVI